MRLMLFWMVPMLLSAELSVDHVTVAGRDLKRMQAALGAVGLPVEYGGTHANHATEMAITSFPDGSYLELIALRPDADAAAVAAHPWAAWMKGDAGPCAWAVRVKDMAAEVARLKAAGVEVGAPVRSGRERPDGVRLDWETARVGAEPNGTFFPFLIHDFTERKARAFPSGKAGAKDFSGITRVVIAVRSLKDAVERYKKAYGLGAPLQQVDREFGAHLALLGGTPVVLAAPLTSQTWLAERLEKFGEGPCAFVLGARKPGKYKAASEARWFGTDIFWFDEAALGWRLGFE
ncbi:MAG: VOC family protein [Acidobacteriota bacterium]